LNRLASVLEELAQSVIDGDGELVAALVRRALSENVPPPRIINEGLIAGMNVVGERFKNGEFFIPEVLMSARSMHGGLAIVKPLLSRSDEKGKGTIVICTVKGDVHDIGKNLVAMMLEGGGFKVVDLGTDVPPERVVSAVREHSPDILAMSTLLTTTLPRIAETIRALEAAGVRGRVKVMVGGAPVTQAFAERAGADGYAPDAALAVELARKLLGI
jgi:5-methyltetrahydrofolate--homocysteine methyltransferase